MIEEQYKLLKAFPVDETYLSHGDLEKIIGGIVSYDQLMVPFNDLFNAGLIEGFIPLPGLRITQKGLKAISDYEADLQKEKSMKESKPKINEPDRPHKHNFLHGLDNGALIGIIIFVAGIVFWAGWYFGERKADLKNIELRQDIKRLDESLRICSSLSVSNNIPNQDADSNKNQVRPDTSHSAKVNKSNLQPRQLKSKSDTSTKVTIQGKNINTGTNNGIIGDDATVNVNNQPNLTDRDKKYILEQVQMLRKKADTSLVFIYTGSGTNAGQYISDLKTFLRNNGYIVNQAISLSSYSGIHFDVGLYVDNKTKVIEIHVGNLQ